MAGVEQGCAGDEKEVPRAVGIPQKSAAGLAQKPSRAIAGDRGTEAPAGDDSDAGRGGVDFHRCSPTRVEYGVRRVETPAFAKRSGDVGSAAEALHACHLIWRDRR